MFVHQMLVSRGAATIAAVSLLATAGCNLGADPVTYELVDPNGFPPAVAPSWVDSGDVDGDGDLDLLAVGSGGYGVLRNDGTGDFELDVHAGVASVGSPSLADLDGDLDLDVLGLSGGGPSAPAVISNDGAGGFGQMAVIGTTPPPGESSDVLSADVDGDGDLDVLVTLLVGPDRHLGVYLNDGTGTFGVPSTYSFAMNLDTADSVDLAVGDIDGDGDDDAVATTAVDATVPGGNPHDGTAAMVAVNDGTGIFTPLGTTLVAHVADLRPTLADLDGDAILDLAFGGSRSVTTLIADGSGGFAAPRMSTVDVTGGIIMAVVAADIDGDGVTDLVGPYARNGGVVVYGDGTGGVAEIHKVPTGTTGELFFDQVITDLEGDGDPDIVTVDGSKLGVLENAVAGRPNH